MNYNEYIMCQREAFTPEDNGTTDLPPDLEQQKPNNISNSGFQDYRLDNKGQCSLN